MKKVEKEIYQNKISQLHNATLQFSKNTLEIKKLFSTVVIGFFTITTGLDTNISMKKQLVILVILTLLFWILDAQSYYYQKKLRQQMQLLENKLLEKEEELICNQCKYANLKKIIFSVFNSSMFIYHVGIVVLISAYFFIT